MGYRPCTVSLSEEAGLCNFVKPKLRLKVINLNITTPKPLHPKNPETSGHQNPRRTLKLKP